MPEIISLSLADLSIMDWISIVLFIGTWVWLGGHAILWWKRRRNPAPVEDQPVLDLNDPVTRTRLQLFLQKHQIVGDAEIRNGFVFSPVPPERLEPLARVLDRAVGLLVELPNQAADALYLFSEKSGPKITEIDLSDVAEAGRVMRRVAEDRKKSRSLYKGYTDDELRAVVRAGLSQWYKDHGDFDYSNKVMAGDYDDDRVVQQGLYILDLLFKIKGARND